MAQLNLELDSFEYNDKFTLARASLAQIVIAMDRTQSRLTDPESDFQKILYPWFQQNLPTLVQKFKDMLTYSSETERNVKFFNLGGSLPKKISVKLDFHNRVQLGNGNFGPFLKAAVQRVKYILDRDVPERYDGNEVATATFNSLREALGSYHEYLVSLEEEYNDVVNKARKTVDMEEVKRLKKEKRRQKRLDKNDNVVVEAVENAEPTPTQGTSVETA